ncbi:hypothetical protein BAE44_0000291, partial [Dichanthelium oligosanthes]
LREQWLFAPRRYSLQPLVLASRDWPGGAAILAGAALFALGWAVKGGSPTAARRGRTGTEAYVLPCCRLPL